MGVGRERGREGGSQIIAVVVGEGVVGVVLLQQL